MSHETYELLALIGRYWFALLALVVVLRGWQRMRELGGQMHLTHVAPQPRKVFETAGVGRMMTINAGEETEYAAH